MAKVRMYAPKPMRKIKRYRNKGRWLKQREIDRNGQKDHAGDTPPVTGPMSITGRTPATIPTAAAPTTTVTATGIGFVAGMTIKYKVGVAAEKTAATSTYVSPTSYTFVIPAADLATAGAIAWTMAVPSGTPVSGPNITRV